MFTILTSLLSQVVEPNRVFFDDLLLVTSSQLDISHSEFIVSSTFSLGATTTNNCIHKRSTPIMYASQCGLAEACELFCRIYKYLRTRILRQTSQTLIVSFIIKYIVCGIKIIYRTLSCVCIAVNCIGLLLLSIQKYYSYIGGRSKTTSGWISMNTTPVPRIPFLAMFA